MQTIINTSSISKKGIFFNFKEKHPRVTKFVKIGVYSVSALAAAAGVCGGGYIIFRNPERGGILGVRMSPKRGFVKWLIIRPNEPIFKL